MYQENFVSVRSIYPRITERRPSRMAVAPPADATERDYRDLLSEANLNYFHREYAIALQNYLSLRQLILTQSHPELPATGGLGAILDLPLAVVPLDRLFELSRRMTDVQAKLPVDPKPRFAIDEVEPNPQLRDLAHVGVRTADTELRALRVAGMRDRARALVGRRDSLRVAANVVDRVSAFAGERRTLGLVAANGTVPISLDADQYAPQLREKVYQPRIHATRLEELQFYEVVETNFVSYFVHLYYFVLPIALGDTYLAQGRYAKALSEYRSVLQYPFLNLGIEAPYVWLKLANAYLQWGHHLFRRGHEGTARQKYEAIIEAELSVPGGSELYTPSQFSALKSAVTEVAKELRGEAHAPQNPRIGQIVAQTLVKLRYLSQGLNFFGVGPDDAPVFRFKYLQSVATYMADSAVEAERTFVSFRSTAEGQKMEGIQLQGALDVNQAALAVEHKRLQDAALEVQSAERTLDYAETRKDNADAALAEWDTKGRELTSMSSALSWASNAANDQDIIVRGVQYDGGSHDFEGDVEDFYEVVGQKRDWLDWELQRNRIVRQQAEIAAEVAMAEVRVEQAKVRREVQELNVIAQQKRVEAAQEALDYAQDKLFDEDLWFQMAGHLQDLARDYLDAAIYSALLMERAYDLEFDRRLNRIRTDYGIGNPAGLLGGDYLKRDILSFTQDYLQHAQKHNPVRCPLSLREEFPSGFATFVETGIFPFRTDLEIFDRRYPGSFRRKLKRVEVFVEGLVPLEGVSGFLSNQGICSEWRDDGSGWAKHTRVTPVERMVLSSYQFRRDIAVFQPSEELLGLFENLSPQCEWTLEIPRSGNNLDYQAISDIKLVLYFDADHDDGLRAHLASTVPTTSARSSVLSSRFHYPDAYFRLDAERNLRFEIDARSYAFHHVNPTFTALGARLLPKPGFSPAGWPLTMRRLSDDTTVTAATDGDGVIQSAGNPDFDVWLGGSGVETFVIELDEGADLSQVSDVQLFYTYAFAYRPDGVLPS